MEAELAQKKMEPRIVLCAGLLVGAARSPVSADSRAPPKFKQRTTPTFKSKALKPDQKGSRDDIPGMAGLGTDVAVVCSSYWEAFMNMELSDLVKYGIV
ncbi:retinal cone rhodopsin-sensitive cGMP 3',5'-cyclic phosphodiesterase subunit gamma-like [Pseudoliparis swirei]|uniref:retinal cone rhodopsin-sensitive cGMP 3',5'-cyclic phosphodiesterase subunit gamma-like n=1 Tax=Pseudoliparis swirei TaxID=2059687 RepID=UPI0024BEA394|nr:retinal cone rhodopsin-sensitive cGMP 3',5'-cyclic phosphodiesterase subunit gamma-like [Pseudoliparis swirei]